MTYKIQKLNNNFQVIETATNKMMGSFKTHEEANALYRHLKDGGGFAGWTPDFIK